MNSQVTTVSRKVKSGVIAGSSQPGGAVRTAAATSYTNSTAITITDCPDSCPASGQAASLYPSNITVAGEVGVVQRVSVTINGFSHAFPADVDFLLVSPSGRKSVIMSDFGADSPGVSGINVTLDDYADRPVRSTVTGNTGVPFVTGKLSCGELRLDSVGYSSVTNPDYKEGTGLSPAAGITTAGQHSWVRKAINNGSPQDTGDNANDFALVDTKGATLNGVVATLGAPGPERGPTATAYTTTTAPIQHNGYFSVALIDPQQSSTSAPNRARDLTPNPGGNATFGTLKIRRRFTNNTGLPVVALRYRVAIITTNAGGSVPAGQADLRMLNSPAQTITLTDTTTATAQALTLQAPPAQTAGADLTPASPEASSRRPRRSPTEQARSSSSTSAYRRPATSASSSTSKR